jgi:predicted alpha-1,2-mannosidase
MRSLLISVIFLSLLLSCTSKTKNPFDSVNLFIGTGGHGHTHPAATLPFGMMQLGPDTRLEGWDGCSGYHYSDSIIYGFSHTHLSGTGVADYNDLLLMPSTSAQGSTIKKDLASKFSKSNEFAEPGYYQVLLDDENIQVELTTSERGGIHRYRSLNGDPVWVSLDLLHRDEIIDAEFVQVDAYTFKGRRISSAWAEEQHFYFYLKFSEKVRQFSRRSERKRAAFFFKNDPSEIEVRVAMSAVDENGAKKNFEQELKDVSFEELRTNSRSKWEDQLSKIIINGSQEVLTNFYTSLYHASIVPNLFTDVDGRYRGTDKKIHVAENHTQYTIFSLWDTYRTAHPLYTLINPKENEDFIKSMLAHYQDGGKLPVWELSGNYTGCMIGYHTVSVIADAFLKGQQNFDKDLALEAMLHISKLDELGKTEYADKGYVPAHKEHESVSKTLEYAYNDWCIAMMAKEMDRDDIYEEYIQRAQSYKYLFNPDNKFMVPRVENRWLSTFDPFEVNFHFTEANAWQYHLYVPHDVNGLIELFGGKEELKSRLDTLFSTSTITSGRDQADITGLIGQYAHGNEPSHHMAYLYNYVGHPASGQKIIRKILTELYSSKPDGISGNEDCGQMSAWYIMSSLGLYPLAPGSAVYDLGSPIVNDARLVLKDSTVLELVAHNNSDEDIYVQKVIWNGKELNQLYINHSELEKGGLLEFFMGPDPLSIEDQKNLVAFESSIDDLKVLPSPAFSSGGRAFQDYTSVSLNCASEADIFYKIVGDNSEFKKFKKPINIFETSTIQAFSKDSTGSASQVVEAVFRKIPKNRKILINGKYSNQYAAGGDQALIDFLYGGNDFRTGEWQGYEGGSMNAIIDLGELQSLNYLSVNALQDENSWIFMPASVQFFASADGKEYKALADMEPTTSVLEKGTKVESFEWSGNEKARYLRVNVRNRGLCPSGHKGQGNKCWIFLDEITIR